VQIGQALTGECVGVINLKRLGIVIEFLRNEVADSLNDGRVAFDMGEWLFEDNVCGTVCCIAGAIEHLAKVGKFGDAVMHKLRDDPRVRSSAFSGDVIGLSYEEANAMFYPREPYRKGSAFRWEMTRLEAVAALEGIRDGRVIYDTEKEHWVRGGER